MDEVLKWFGILTPPLVELIKALVTEDNDQIDTAWIKMQRAVYDERARQRFSRSQG